MPDERVARLSNELIPASDGLPSASEADPAGKWLDRALAARPDLVRPTSGPSLTAHMIATAGLQAVPA